MRKHMYISGTLLTPKGHFLYLSPCFNFSPKDSEWGWGITHIFSIALLELSAPQNFKKKQTMFLMNVN